MDRRHKCERTAAAANFGLLRSRDGNDALEGRHLAEEPRLSANA